MEIISTIYIADGSVLFLDFSIMQNFYFSLTVKDELHLVSVESTDKKEREESNKIIR